MTQDTGHRREGGRERRSRPQPATKIEKKKRILLFVGGEKEGRESGRGENAGTGLWLVGEEEAGGGHYYYYFFFPHVRTMR